MHEPNINLLLTGRGTPYFRTATTAFERHVMRYSAFLARVRQMLFGKYPPDLGPKDVQASDLGPMSDHDLGVAIREVRDAPFLKDTVKRVARERPQ